MQKGIQVNTETETKPEPEKTKVQICRERAQEATTPGGAKHWARRAFQATGVPERVRWLQRTTRKERPDKKRQKALKRLYKVSGLDRLEVLPPMDKDDIFGLAYQYYHLGRITKKQARILGCNIK